MNWRAVWAIYCFEMARTGRTLLQSIVAPVITTSLYFVVFGAAMGTRIAQIEGVEYGAFIVPGLIMLTLLTQSVTNAAFGIYFPKFVGTIYELLSAPISAFEIVIGYVGAGALAITGAVLLLTQKSGAPARSGTSEGASNGVVVRRNDWAAGGGVRVFVLKAEFATMNGGEVS